MRALRWGQQSLSQARHDWRVSRVLPRLLRRPVRFAARLAQGHIAIPKRTEAFVFGGIIGGAILYGSAMGGQLHTAFNATTASLGFSVAEIELSGNSYTPVDRIYAALGLDGGRSLMTIDPVEARAQLVALPWIEQARIAKVYPATLVIDVAEREPFAVWQTGEALAVVERDGAVIGGYAADPRLAALPLLVGKGADTTGADIVALVSEFPDVAERVRAYIRVDQRRWDLRLSNGITVRLPEGEVPQSLGRLLEMQAELGVFERDLAAIDLRFDDRTLFALTENAMTAHEAAIEARDEMLKNRKRGSSI